MGQKTNPQAMRIGVSKSWPVRWLLRGGYRQFLQEDEAIRKIIFQKAGHAGIARIEIERTSTSLRVIVKTARPGLLIGKGGKGIEELVRELEKKLSEVRGERATIKLDVEELKRTEVAASYVAQQIAWDLERRFPFRRTMKKYLDQVMQNKSVQGAKISLSGRLDGSEFARRETLKRGKLPLQTLRADIDYGTATAFTTYGTIGVKVWVYKGDIFEKEKGGKDTKER
ncbi:30S ribosomal protein S3 [Candidatus Parcubacteria bacterium]|nr:MAG: 30S ribosomal protein S3 [Candidatus Parcubacteria bacterium]